MFDLKRFGVIFFDSNNDDNIYQTVYSIMLLTTGIIQIIMYSLVNQLFDDWSKAFSMSLTAVTISAGIIASLISKMIVIYNVKYKKYQKFKTTLEGFEIYIPMNTIAWKHINMICTELHFAIQCFVVYTKFRDINEKLIQINCEQKYFDYSVSVQYPFTASCRVTTAKNTDDTSSFSVILYEKDFYCPKDKRYLLANTIELLRIKHWLSREAIDDLKCLFGFQMGLSIVILGITTLFDMYTQLFYAYANSSFHKSLFRTTLLFIGWMLQYSLRLCLIVITTHTTIQQAVKTKKLIAKMSNRHTDINTKEELQLFYNQLTVYSPEFTVFDILTIKNSLITSMMCAGATYILILVQFHSERTKNHKDHYLFQSS
ncbi:unnamed protein product [Aphis gossypii]|uniref:Gustatory receptor n=1 Tax=Aphis gossypii TaxID=80765 RepID=A0A9P0J4H8_APHGO|nr:unnamed protein product [Aphis gossypii]